MSCGAQPNSTAALEAAGLAPIRSENLYISPKFSFDFSPNPPATMISDSVQSSFGSFISVLRTSIRLKKRFSQDISGV